MDFGRHSYRPSLKREDSDKASGERKSQAYASISSKRFKGTLSSQDLKKYSLVDTHKQVKEKIINLLIKLDIINSIEELDFKILEKSLNSVLKTITIMLSIVFPSFEAKSATDIFDISFKILQYPYEISNYAFNPWGAPNTWPQIIWLLDWIHDFVSSMWVKSNVDIIAEESNDDEFRRSSMDCRVELLSDQFFTRLPHVPRIPDNSDFMKLVSKMRTQKYYEDRKGIEKGEVPNPQDILKENINQVKKRIEELEAKDKSLKLVLRSMFFSLLTY